MPNSTMDIGKELLNVPMGEMIRSMALAIADGQWALDKASMTAAELMSGQRLLRDLDTGKLIGADGAPTQTAQVIDSRVYFGYTYEQSGNTQKRVPQKVSMMELGFTPNFYQFVDTIIEVRIAITIKGETQEVDSKSAVTTDQGSTSSSSQSAGFGAAYGAGSWWSGWGVSGGSQSRTVASTAQVNASYANKYGYSVEGSSLLRTKLVPIPPPALLEERLRALVETERTYAAWKSLDDQFRAMEPANPKRDSVSKQLELLQAKLAGTSVN